MKTFYIFQNNRVWQIFCLTKQDALVKWKNRAGFYKNGKLLKVSGEPDRIQDYFLNRNVNYESI